MPFLDLVQACSVDYQAFLTKRYSTDGHIVRYVAWPAIGSIS